MFWLRNKVFLHTLIWGPGNGGYVYDSCFSAKTHVVVTHILEANFIETFPVEDTQFDNHNTHTFLEILREMATRISLIFADDY